MRVAPSRCPTAVNCIPRARVGAALASFPPLLARRRWPARPVLDHRARARAHLLPQPDDTPTPLDALESWLALIFKDQRIYLEVLREAYEAWVIYSIQKLFVEFLGGRAGVETVLARHAAAPGAGERAHLLFPFGSLPGWRFREEFQFRSNALVFQYVLLRTVFAVASLFAEANGTLCPGSTDFAHCLYPWATLLLSLSQFGAMYGLLLFFHELMGELAPLKALSKLLVVKAVVFLSFWQGSVISGFEYLGLLRETEFYTTDEISSGLQNFLICWEMAIAAIVHHYVFDWKEVIALAAEGATAMPVFEGGRTTPAAAVVMLMPHDAIVDAQSHLVAAAGVPQRLGGDALRAMRSAAGMRSPEKDVEVETLI